MKEITLYLDDEEAWVLAQLVKRITWSDIRRCAVDDTEAHVMVDAIAVVRENLADAGIAPR